MTTASTIAKQKRTGRCLDCGRTTRYSGKPGKPISERCPTCANRTNGHKRQGQGPNQQAVQKLLQDKDKRYSEIRDTLGLQNHSMGTLLGRLVKQGKIKRVRRGVYSLTSK